MVRQNSLIVVLLLAAVGLNSSDSSAGTLRLHHRIRTETSPGSGRYHVLTKPVDWKAERTAIVVCDMWDRHWCPQATARVAEMAPRMNKVISAARSRGVLIIHCPSSTMDFYRDTPQRKLAQSAPPVETKVPLQSWCHLDEQKEGRLPIDDSDGGCDSESPVRSYRAWTRQHPAIEMMDGDAVTDSAEAFYLMKQRGITNVIVMGVHTNMCVLGRPFSIRQMVQQGQNVVLMRDMTDSMYNPAMRPFVSHFTGTDLVVEHIEKYWCPTILSTDLIGGREFRFREDTRPHLVVLCAEKEYQTHKTLPPFALNSLGHDFRVTLVWDDAHDPHSLPGIEVVRDADVLLVSVRRRTLPPHQLNVIREFVAAGKPVVGLRTASHAFCLRNQPAAEGRAGWPELDRQVFGGNYTNHHPRGAVTTLESDAAGISQFKGLLPVGSHVDFVGNGSLYKVRPLAEGTTVVLTGRIPGAEPEPVAWFFQRADGGLSFYTSLGHPMDFDQAGFRTFLKNALLAVAKAGNNAGEKSQR